MAFDAQWPRRNKLRGDSWPAGEARAGPVEISLQRQRPQ
jgi:hypothetical protein